jgi:butyryl-CoA dehydrogenase
MAGRSPENAPRENAMYDLRLSDEQVEIRDTVRDFVTQEIKPVALKSDRLELMERPLLLDLLDKASQMGLRSLTLSEELGGAGADTLTACLVAEELAVGDVDLAATLTETAGLARQIFGRMNDAQRERFLPQFLSDDRFHLAYADREPDGDGGLGGLYHRPDAREVTVATTATRASNGDFIINGQKDCVPNAGVAKLFAVQVKTGPSRVATVLVPRDAPGLTVRASESAGDYAHGTIGELEFKDCRVPADHLLGGEQANPLVGEPPAFGGDVALAAVNIGIGRAAYEAALDYTQLRVQGGRRIVEHQAIGMKLAEMAIALRTSRSSVWEAAWAADHADEVCDGVMPAALALIAKSHAAESIYHVAKEAAECFGAMGVMKDMPLQKYIGDALVFVHARGGSTETKLQIAEALVGHERQATQRMRAAE